MKWSNPTPKRHVQESDGEAEFVAEFEKSISRRAVEEHLDNREALLGAW